MQFYKISSEQSFLSFWAKLFIMHMVGHLWFLWLHMVLTLENRDSRNNINCKLFGSFI